MAKEKAAKLPIYLLLDIQEYIEKYKYKLFFFTVMGNLFCINISQIVYNFRADN